MYRQSINSQMGYQQEDSLHSNQPENSDNKQQSMNSSRSQQSSHEQLSTQESSHQSKGKRRTILKETTQSISKISTLLKSLKRLDERERKVLQNVDLRKHYKLKDNKIKTQKRIVFKKRLMKCMQTSTSIHWRKFSDEDDNENHIDVELNDSSDHPSTKSFEEDQIGASSYNTKRLI